MEVRKEVQSWQGSCTPSVVAARCCQLNKEPHRASSLAEMFEVLDYSNIAVKRKPEPEQGEHIANVRIHHAR
jgi:hypothetical protein